jgi:uncharacterized protein
VKRDFEKHRSQWTIWLGILLTCMVGMFTTYYLFVEAPPPRRLVIATGSKEGAYYRFAEEYAKRLKDEKFTLEIRSTEGAVENVKLLLDESSDVNIAFVQTGVADPDQCDSLSALASLYREPLWIFYRGPEVIDRLTQLEGRRVSIGAVGSGTRGVVEQLLKSNGFDEESKGFKGLGGNEAADALVNNEIDVAFFVAGIDAKYIQRLIKMPEIHLAELIHAKAYVRQYRFLSTITINRGLLNLKEDIPAKDIELIAPAATLVARKSLHPALVPLLLKTTDAVHHNGGLLSNVGEFPSPLMTDIPLNDDASRFFRSGPPVLQRFLPFWLASLVDRLKIMMIPLIMLMMPLLRAAPPFVRWQTRRKIYKWYAELRKIDQHTINGMSQEEATRTSEHLHRLEQRIARVGVPLSYMEEYYNMRVHLNLVRTRVNSILKPSETVTT